MSDQAEQVLIDPLRDVLDMARDEQRIVAATLRQHRARMRQFQRLMRRRDGWAERVQYHLVAAGELSPPETIYVEIDHRVVAIDGTRLLDGAELVVREEPGDIALYLNGAEHKVIDVVGGGVWVERASVEAAAAELAEQRARAEEAVRAEQQVLTEKAAEEKLRAEEARRAERAAFEAEFEALIDKLFEVALAEPAPSTPDEAWPIPPDVSSRGLRGVWVPYLTWRAGLPAVPDPPYKERLEKLEALAGKHARSTFQGWEKELKAVFKKSIEKSV
jgi:hypothetical protein